MGGHQKPLGNYERQKAAGHLGTVATKIKAIRNRWVEDEASVGSGFGFHLGGSLGGWLGLS